MLLIYQNNHLQNAKLSINDLKTQTIKIINIINNLRYNYQNIYYDILNIANNNKIPTTPIIKTLSTKYQDLINPNIKHKYEYQNYYPPLQKTEQLVVCKQHQKKNIQLTFNMNNNLKYTNQEKNYISSLKSEYKYNNFKFDTTILSMKTSLFDPLINNNNPSIFQIINKQNYYEHILSKIQFAYDPQPKDSQDRNFIPKDQTLYIFPKMNIDIVNLLTKNNQKIEKFKSKLKFLYIKNNLQFYGAPRINYEGDIKEISHFNLWSFNLCGRIKYKSLKLKSTTKYQNKKNNENNFTTNLILAYNINKSIKTIVKAHLQNIINANLYQIYKKFHRFIAINITLEIENIYKLNWPSFKIAINIKKFIKFKYDYKNHLAKRHQYELNTDLPDAKILQLNY